MTGIGWLLRHTADVPVDVPADDEWLSPREREVQARFVVPKRRADWRLGRWTAKAALAASLGLDRQRLASIAVIAADDGAPEPLLDDRPLAVSLSISHREGTGLAVVGHGRVGHGGVVVGGDLEVIEPRTDRFVREWFAPEEQALVTAASVDGRHDEMACLIWSVKEAAAKVLREGLRLNVREGVVWLGNGPSVGGWCRSSVTWSDPPRVIGGWWRIEAPLIITIACDQTGSMPSRAPEPLGDRHCSGPYLLRDTLAQ